MSERKNSANETDTESENEEPMPKRPALSRSNVSSSHSNGNQVLFNTENKSYINKSDDEVSPTKISSSDDECDRPNMSIGPTTSSSSIELQVVNRIQSDNVKASHNDTLGLRIENKIISNVYRQDIQIKNRMMKDKDSGMSSCQESSQEFSAGRVGRSESSGSTKSFDSQSTECTTQTIVSDEEDQQILQRAAEFTVAKNAKDFDATETQLGICNFCMSNKKDGVFVHSNSLHLCCCYKCAVKVWKKRKCCPICNQKIKNVSKLFVH